MNYYVNLPLSWVHKDLAWLERLFAHGLNPELGFDAVSVALPLRWHRDIAARIADQGLCCSAHLPFFMPPPGSPDRSNRLESESVLCHAAELAAVYQARHLIGHPVFVERINAAPGRSPGAEHGFSLTPAQEWLENSALIWRKVMQTGPARLFLENTFETDPVPLISLLGWLPGAPATGESAESQGAAMCFDAGHWFCFAGGSAAADPQADLERWLNYIAPRLGHLHLHDNDGGGDRHLGLGRGKIPLERLFELLLRYGLKPTFTLEPHDLESLAHSLAWLERNQHVRAWLEKAGNRNIA